MDAPLPQHNVHCILETQAGWSQAGVCIKQNGAGSSAPSSNEVTSLKGFMAQKRLMLLRRKAQKPSAEPEVPKLPNPANTEPHLEGAGAEA